MSANLRFLVIQLRQIGDVLISTTVCTTLKQNYPDAQVDYVVYPYTAPVAENNPNIDNLVIVPNGTSLRKMWEMSRKKKWLRKQHYDCVIDIVCTPKSVRLGKSVQGKSFIGPDCGKLRCKTYDAAIKFDPTFLEHDRACYSVKNRLYLLSAINKPLQYETHYKFYLTEAEQQTAQLTLQALNVEACKPRFFFSTGSRSPQQKQWPLDYFIKVMNYCVKAFDAQLILCPGPNEAPQAKELRNQLQQPEACTVLADYSLRQMAAVLAECNLYIGNDSGQRHIAIGLDIPSIAIFSPAIKHDDWNPHHHPMHVAVTLQDALLVDDEDYQQLLKKMRPDDLPGYYNQITPSIVEIAIDELAPQVLPSARSE
jgi:heptosyltransferase-2